MPPPYICLETIRTMIDTRTILISIGVLIALMVVYYYFYRRDKKSLPATDLSPIVASTPPAPATHAMQLAAYERLVILADRIALPNLISRSNQPGLGKQEMQLLLVQTIRQEYEHNLSQQIYVSAEAWEAVRNLKDQNIHLINQVASVLPPDAEGVELNRRILDFIVSQPQGSLHTLVQDAVSEAARRLMS